jgi:hypothetical protein
VTDTRTTDPCYYCNDAGCASCDATLDTTPGGIVRLAADRIGESGYTDTSIYALTADLLQVIGDDMADSGAKEQEYPNHAAFARWQVVDEYGKGWINHPGWDEALKLARAILGQSEPNRADHVVDSQAVVDHWNEQHPVGTSVRYWTGDRQGDGKVSRTRSRADLLGGHTAVVWVEGHGACIALSHIRVLTEAEAAR